MIQEAFSPAEKSDRVAISIVSHGHGAMVSSLLADLAIHCGSGISVILTLNIPESPTMGDGEFPFPVKVIRNTTPKGFGANHNAAFRHCHSPYFCVLNPDINIAEDPFPGLIRELQIPRSGLAAPRIVNPDGETEDSAAASRRSRS